MKDHGESSRKRIKETLQHLIESAEGKTDRTRGLTVSKLLTAADVSRSTFYAYYGNLEDAVEDLAMDFSTHLIDELRKSRKAAPGVQGYLNGYLSILQTIYQHQKLLRVLMNHRNFGDMFLDAVREYLAAQYTVEFPDEDYTTLRYSALASTYFVYSMIVEWERNDFDKTPEEIAEIFQGSLKLSLRIFQPRAESL